MIKEAWLRKIRKKQFDDDDGRTIVDMNVDGMPWYDRRRDITGQANREPSQPSPYGAGMTDRELRLYIWGALKAGLLVALVFAVTCKLLVLFLTKVVCR